MPAALLNTFGNPKLVFGRLDSSEQALEKDIQRRNGDYTVICVLYGLMSIGLVSIRSYVIFAFCLSFRFSRFGLICRSGLLLFWPFVFLAFIFLPFPFGLLSSLA